MTVSCSSCCRCCSLQVTVLSEVWRVPLQVSDFAKVKRKQTKIAKAKKKVEATDCIKVGHNIERAMRGRDTESVTHLLVLLQLERVQLEHLPKPAAPGFHDRFSKESRSFLGVEKDRVGLLQHNPTQLLKDGTRVHDSGVHNRYKIHVELALHRPHRLGKDRSTVCEQVALFLLETFARVSGQVMLVTASASR